MPPPTQDGLAGGGAGRFLKEVDALCSGGGSSSIALRQLQQLVDTAAAAAMLQASTGGALLALLKACKIAVIVPVFQRTRHAFARWCYCIMVQRLRMVN